VADIDGVLSLSGCLGTIKIRLFVARPQQSVELTTEAISLILRVLKGISLLGSEGHSSEGLSHRV
jgi:hypothetical protein